MQTTTQSRRQTMGCGFEPAAPPDRVYVWRHRAYRGEPPTTCPAFTTRLPIVLEVSRARLHWEKGVVLATMTDALANGIEVLEASAREVQNWLATPSKRGGGGA